MSNTIYLFDKNKAKRYENPTLNILNNNIIKKTKKNNCETPFIMPIKGVRKTSECRDCLPNTEIYKDDDRDKACAKQCKGRVIKNSNSIILNNNFFF